MGNTHAPRPRKNRDTLHNEDWLRGQYLDARLSAKEIARRLGCSDTAVRWALRKFGIPTRSLSEEMTGRPSTTVWTPEMRESLAAQRRGERNPMFGTVSPWRGQHKPVDQVTRHYGRGRARVIHAAQPCEVCGAEKAERHHRNGNATDNSRENIAFYCRYHHLHVGHNGRWGALNLPPGMSDERPAGPPLVKKPPMSPEQEAAWREGLRERAKVSMTTERAAAMARKSHESRPMTPERAKAMASRPRPPWSPERRSKMEAMWAAKKAAQHDS